MRVAALLLTLLPGVSAVAEVPVPPLRYTAGAFEFHESQGAGPGDLDTLQIRARMGEPVSVRFNRSRGIGDVADFTALGNLRVGATRVMSPDGRLTSSRKGTWVLSEDVSVQGSTDTIILGSRRQRCSANAPAGLHFEKLVEGRQPRSMAVSGDAVLATLEGRPRAGHQMNLTPVRINLKTCRIEVGSKFVSPGFDYRLQVRAGQAMLVSRSESGLLLSSDGLNWQREELPAMTHTLLAATVTNEGIQAAISRADKDFELGIFRQVRSGQSKWTEGAITAPSALPWIEVAREAALAASVAH